MRATISFTNPDDLVTAESIMKNFTEKTSLMVDGLTVCVSGELDDEKQGELKGFVSMINAQISNSSKTFTVATVPAARIQ